MRSFLGVVLAGVLFLSGCALLGFEPSPATSYTDASGNTVNVEWVDYRGHAGSDGATLIGYPDQAELEPGLANL